MTDCTGLNQEPALGATKMCELRFVDKDQDILHRHRLVVESSNPLSRV